MRSRHVEIGIDVVAATSVRSMSKAIAFAFRNFGELAAFLFDHRRVMRVDLVSGTRRQLERHAIQIVLV
jgi:hypothetical protein